MGHMATMLSKSTSEVNPRREGIEQYKAITLRSGREVAAPGPPLVIVKEPKQSYQFEADIGTTQEDKDQPHPTKQFCWEIARGRESGRASIKGSDPTNPIPSKIEEG